MKRFYKSILMGGIVWFVWLSLFIGLANAFSVNYTDFSDLSAFTLNGEAAIINSSGPVYYNGQNVLRLTDYFWQVGSAFLTNPVNMGPDYSFSSYFTFQFTNTMGISDSDGPGADGITFTLQTVGSNVVGGVGGNLGYWGINPSVGIEFDTWDNRAQDGWNGNHVGIDVDGSMFSLARYNVATRMNNGAIWYAWIDYNGTNDLLEVRLSQTASRPINPILSYTIDLPSILGSPYVYVGFTAATGGDSENHDIRSWQFTTNVNTVPEPSTLLLVISGFLGMLNIKRFQKS